MRVNTELFNTMKTTPVALGDELTRRIDGLTIGGQPMNSSARNVLLALCTRSDRNRETEIVLVRDERSLASELECLDEEQLAALVSTIQHKVWIIKGKIHVSPHYMPKTQEQEDAA